MDNYLIISFCNFDYIKLAKIWFEQINKLNINNYIIIAADNATYSYLNSQNIKTKLTIKDKKDNFWLYRMRVIISFLESKKFKYLIHSDLDAIFKKNICEDLLKQNNIDLFFSQGTVCPEKHLLKHKFVLCCGFFCIKCNDNTISFFNKYFINLKKTSHLHDQIAINIELIDTEWTYEISDQIPHEDTLFKNKYIIFKKDILGVNKKYNLNLLLISFLKIQRNFVNNNGYIYHIVSPPCCGKKIQHFKNLKII